MKYRKADRFLKGDSIMLQWAFRSHIHACCVALLLGLLATPASAATGKFTIAVEGQEGDFTVWVPDDVPRVRGLIYLMSGHTADTGTISLSPYCRQAARSLGFGTMGYKARERNLRVDKDNTTLQRSLDAAAVAVGHPELSNVPVAVTGMSAAGYYSVAFAKANPTRVVAAAYGWQGLRNLDDDANMAQVPTLMMAGSKDNAAPPTRPGVIQANHAYRRANFSAQAAFAMDWGAPHGMDFNQGTDAAFFWIGEIVRLRYPMDVVPSLPPGQPVALKTLDIAAGWLGDTTQFADDYTTPTTISPFVAIASVAEYKGDPKLASWLPSQDAAFVYRALASLDSIEALERRLALPRVKGQQRNAPYQGELKFLDIAYNSLGHHTDAAVDTEVMVKIDPREFVAAADKDNRITEMVLYDGSKEIGRAAAPTTGTIWSFSFKPDWAGAHGLVVIATDARGRRTSSFTTLFVHAPIPAPAGAQFSEDP
jgi:dienelactone hydrolase